MQATRTLIGALVGLALGIAVLIVFNVNLKQDAWWTFIPVGLVAGLAMRMLASTGRPSYGRGALAALLTGVIAACGPFIVAEIFKKNAPATIASKTATVVESEVAEGEASTGEATTLPEEIERVAPTAPVGTIGVQPSKTFEVLDAIWLGAAVLIAYELGKGSCGKPEDEADEATPAEGAAAEPVAEEPTTTEA